MGVRVDGSRLSPKTLKKRNEARSGKNEVICFSKSGTMPVNVTVRSVQRIQVETADKNDRGVLHVADKINDLFYCRLVPKIGEKTHLADHFFVCELRPERTFRWDRPKSSPLQEAVRTHYRQKPQVHKAGLIFTSYVACNLKSL